MPLDRVGYKPSYAQRQTRAQRWKEARLERDDLTRQDRSRRQAQGCSIVWPAQRSRRELSSQKSMKPRLGHTAPTSSKASAFDHVVRVSHPVLRIAPQEAERC